MYNYIILIYICLGNPYMMTKRLPQLSKLRLLSKGSLGFIVGFIHSDFARPHYGNDPIENESIFNVSVDPVNGLKTYRFKKPPTLILLKIRNCKRELVKGYPPGVVGIPSTSTTVNVRLPHTRKVKRMKITQFAMIPANAMTPEKLQGNIVNTRNKS